MKQNIHICIKFFEQEINNLFKYEFLQKYPGKQIARKWVDKNKILNY